MNTWEEINSKNNSEQISYIFYIKVIIITNKSKQRRKQEHNVYSYSYASYVFNYVRCF